MLLLFPFLQVLPLKLQPSFADWSEIHVDLRQITQARTASHACWWHCQEYSLHTYIKDVRFDLESITCMWLVILLSCLAVETLKGKTKEKEKISLPDNQQYSSSHLIPPYVQYLPEVCTTLFCPSPSVPVLDCLN